jgi:hypothetical protein
MVVREAMSAMVRHFRDGPEKDGYHVARAWNLSAFHVFGGSAGCEL